MNTTNWNGDKNITPMETVEQTIKKGSIVESIRHGYQGIVKSVYSNLWSIQGSRKCTQEWLGMQEPPVTKTQATSERWFEVSDFRYMGFTSFESDLRIIEAHEIRLHEYPASFVSVLLRVDKKEDGIALLQLEHTTTYNAHRPSFLTIKNPTVIPYVGDHICGTQDIVIISGDGVDYPYRLQEKILTQDW